MITLNPPFTATSMQQLCQRVLKGSYPPIPKEYSKDLNTVIATLLQVNPKNRPSCDQILHLPSVEEHLTDEQTREISMNLLNTIKIPRGNIRQLNSQLPKKNYDEPAEEIKEIMDDDEDLARAASEPMVH